MDWQDRIENKIDGIHNKLDTHLDRISTNETNICVNCKQPSTKFKSCSSCRAKDRVRTKKYRQSAKGKASRLAYSRSDKMKEYQRVYQDRLRKDPVKGLVIRLRRRLGMAVANGKKCEKTADLLGCTLIEFKLYIESQFQPGMSWVNRSEWHLDHVIPLDFYDLTEETQLREACHYLNIQPLWAAVNLSKGNKVGLAR